MTLVSIPFREYAVLSRSRHVDHPLAVRAMHSISTGTPRNREIGLVFLRDREDIWADVQTFWQLLDRNTRARRLMREVLLVYTIHFRKVVHCSQKRGNLLRVSFTVENVFGLRCSM